MADRRRGYLANLLGRFEQRSDSECWLWKGHVGQNGYARFVFKVEGKAKCKIAHRAVYEALVGPIAEGLVLDHLCKNRACVNPAHLEPVTQQENLHRSDNHVGQNARKTHCVHGHEFTDANTYRPPKRPNRRYCRTCINRRAAAGGPTQGAGPNR